MKILFVTTVSNTINAFLISHIRMLVNMGHHVDIACDIAQELNSEIEILGCKVHRMSFKRTPLSAENYYAYKQFRALCKSEGYNLIHTHTPIASVISRLALRKEKNIKMVYTAHGFHFYKGAPKQNWIIYYTIEKWLSKYTDCLITINNEDHNIAQSSGFSAPKVYQVNGVGISLEALKPLSLENKTIKRESIGISKNAFVLFYAAELNHNKHQDLLIESIDILKDKIPSIKLLLAGEGPMASDYQTLVNKKNLQSHIEFLGYRKDVPDLLNIADVAVSSSRREGLPVNVMEAMAMGLPVVATDCRGHRDLISNNENGILADKDSPYMFADAILKLFESDKLRNTYGSNNEEKIKNYSIEYVLKQMREIYNQFLL